MIFAVCCEGFTTETVFGVKPANWKWFPGPSPPETQDSLIILVITTKPFQHRCLGLMRKWSMKKTEGAKNLDTVPIMAEWGCWSRPAWIHGVLSEPAVSLTDSATESNQICNAIQSPMLGRHFLCWHRSVIYAAESVELLIISGNTNSPHNLTLRCQLCGRLWFSGVNYTGESD